jgi:hypothetical protein
MKDFDFASKHTCIAIDIYSELSEFADKLEYAQDQLARISRKRKK